MTRARLDRINDFEEFYKNALGVFTEFLNSDNRVKDFEEIYKLGIYPKNVVDESNIRNVEISWGFRKYERVIDVRNNKKKALIEQGATLFYERLDSGHIIILLYPAHSENRMQIESSITLKRRLDPKKLKNKKYLKNNWNDLIAYMESTSLDGNPSLFQRMRIFYLRTFKHLIIDNIAKPTRLSKYLKDTIKFVASVGLSGFIVYFITLCLQNENDKLIKKQIDITNKLINSVSLKLDSVPNSQSLLKTLQVLTDSIKIKTDQISKKVDIHKDKKNVTK
jgi:hypothetical protein